MHRIYNILTLISRVLRNISAREKSAKKSGGRVWQDTPTERKDVLEENDMLEQDTHERKCSVDIQRFVLEFY